MMGNIESLEQAASGCQSGKKDISSRSGNCQEILTSVWEFCIYSQKLGNFINKISRTLAKAFFSCLDFIIIE